ncbi:MucBP domain-containing protein [Candidatus Enterococcus mansonii]|uniref:MucBP domain-containing protein n=1 Tax=Candidatus Enterococcus mansonii TaxID=1834181 RepID=A0A242CH56_9ENTE|nr:MucBP domain-containing protein [Enterococcus sp. 4G2_DIV0659]OTO09565.1 hypothetical protein A5880_000244 [Enterococcus sp. 4G2_DIV0659]
MRKNSFVFFSLMILSFFLTIGSISYAEEQKNGKDFELTSGWTVDFSTNLPQVGVDSVFSENHINKDINQKMIISNVANIGDAKFTATKAIPMKKGRKYTIDLIYAMKYNVAQRGWIDFNGETIYSEMEPYPYDKEYKKTIIPEEDTTYVITVHFDVKMRENAYFKLGHLLDNDGIEEIPDPVDSSVTARYLSEDEQPLLENDVITGQVGESYSIPQKEIDGYTLKEVQGEASGQFTNEPKEVRFIYSKNTEENGVATAYYQDEDGNDLEEPIIKQGAFGEEYQFEPKEINGYKLLNIQGEPKGAFKLENQSIVYTYKPIDKDTSNSNGTSNSNSNSNKTLDSKVTIYYIDENGNELAEPMIKNGLFGQTYTVDVKEIPLYALKEIKDEHSGNFSGDDQVVKCIYIKQEFTSVTNPTQTEKSKSIPLLGEQSKRLLQILGALILAAILTIYIVKKRKKLR